MNGYDIAVAFEQFASRSSWTMSFPCLKDVDHIDDFPKPIRDASGHEPPLQVVFDFEEDVVEMEIAKGLNEDGERAAA